MSIIKLILVFFITYLKYKNRILSIDAVLSCNHLSISIDIGPPDVGITDADNVKVLKKVSKLLCTLKIFFIYFESAKLSGILVIVL